MKQNIWRNNLLKVLTNLNIPHPKNYSLYMEALTHSSYANENGLKYNYERLEFLGDAAIEWVIVNYLYGKNNPKLSEGEMSIRKSNVVKQETLVKACKEIELFNLMFLGKSINEENIPDKIYEDIFEAFVGAVAQDQGIKKVSILLNKTIIKYYEKDLLLLDKDFKTKFQECIQASNIYKPLYEHIDGKMKICRLYCVDTNGNKLLYGEGKAKKFKDADQLAAKEALKKMANVKTKKRRK